MLGNDSQLALGMEGICVQQGAQFRQQQQGQRVVALWGGAGTLARRGSHSISMRLE